MGPICISSPARAASRSMAARSAIPEEPPETTPSTWCQISPTTTSSPTHCLLRAAVDQRDLVAQRARRRDFRHRGPRRYEDRELRRGEFGEQRPSDRDDWRRRLRADPAHPEKWPIASGAQLRVRDNQCGGPFRERHWDGRREPQSRRDGCARPAHRPRGFRFSLERETLTPFPAALALDMPTPQRTRQARGRGGQFRDRLRGSAWRRQAARRRSGRLKA